MLVYAGVSGRYTCFGILINERKFCLINAGACINNQSPYSIE